MTDRQTREHPPVNGCTLRGQHACILTTGRPVPTVLAAAIDRKAASAPMVDPAAQAAADRWTPKAGDVYGCPDRRCGYSRIILTGETVADAQRAHEGTDVHRYAIGAIPAYWSNGRSGANTTD